MSDYKEAMLPVSVKELCEQVKAFRQRVMPYWKEYVEFWGHPELELETLDFQESYVDLISEEYNTACNCHPEYARFEYPFYPDDFCWTPQEFREKLEEEEKRKRAEDRKRERERHKREKKALEEGERKLLARLKKKYES